MNHDYDEDLEHKTRGRSRRKQSAGSHEETRQTEYLEKDTQEQELEAYAEKIRREVSRKSDEDLTGSDIHHETARRRTPQKTQKKRRSGIIKMIVAECFALLFIFSYAFFAKKWNLIQRPEFEVKNVENQELTVDTLSKMKGYWMIAVFGVDSRNNNVGKGTNSDVNMICCVNRDTGEIKLVSVYRDTYLNISDKNTYNKINAAYANGGPEQAVKALNKNLDLNITDYVTFNWKAVADTINILGGVDLEISKAEFAYINSFITETVKVTGVASRHLKSAGMNHLDGVQAVAYGRLRLMDTDFARTERQRKIIQLAFDKMKKSNISTVNNVVEVVFPQVATGIDLQDVANVAFSLSKYHIGETSGFPTARGDANMGKKGACVIPQTLESNVIQLHQFLFGDEGYTTTNSVKNISAKISADTGMYKTGTPVGHVSTEGYIPKATTAASNEDEEETSEGETVEKMTDEDGNVILPTDEDGNILEIPTDENGNPIDLPETSAAVKPGSTTESNENLTESSSSHPGNTEKATTAVGPGTVKETTKAEHPGSTAETTKAVYPGSTAETTKAVYPGSATETTAETTKALQPGASVETTEALQPGAVTSTTAAVVQPGGGITIPTVEALP